MQQGCFLPSLRAWSYFLKLSELLVKTKLNDVAGWGHQGSSECRRKAVMRGQVMLYISHAVPQLLVVRGLAKCTT